VASQTLRGTSTTTAAPRVNLLPPEIAEKSRLRKAQFAMVGTGLAAVAVVGVMYTQQSAKVDDAQQQKAAAEAAHVRLTTEKAKLQNVSDTYAQVDQAKATLAAAMHDEVLWSGYLHDLTLTIPENVWLTGLTAKIESVKAPANGSSGPVLDPGLGTVTFTGHGFVHDDVAAWLESVAKEKGYANPYFSQSVEALIGTVPVVTFSSTVNLTEKALSNRYTMAKGLER
jgi:Tfp pilus assembly protein PilN